MNTRNTIALIVSLLIIIALTLWVSITRIIESILPAMVNNGTIRIETLIVSSIGLRQIGITRVSGYVFLDLGRVSFDITDASINYDIDTLRPNRTEIDKAIVEFKPSTTRQADKPRTDGALIFPPELVIQRLLLRSQDDTDWFDGYLELHRQGDEFTASAIDDENRVTISGNADLSMLAVSLQQPGGDLVASGNIELEDDTVKAVEADVELGPALIWLRTTPWLPRHFQEILHDLRAIDGRVSAEVMPAGDNLWLARTRVDVRNLNTATFYGGMRMQGDLTLDTRGGEFSLVRPGILQLHVPSDRVTEISTITMDIPAGYKITQSTTPRGETTLTGSGTAQVVFSQTDDTDIGAELIAWSLQEWREATVELSAVVGRGPLPVTAAAARSSFRLTNISPLLLNGNADVTNARVTEWPDELAGISLGADWEWNDGAVDIHGSAQWGGSKLADWSLRNNSKHGVLNIGMNKTVAEVMPSLRRYLHSQALDFEFSEGDINAELTSTWDNIRYSSGLELSVDNVTGRVFGVDIKGGALNLSSADLTTLSFKFEASVPAATLANGVEVDTVSVGGRLQDSLYVDHAMMSVFGGKLKVNPVVIQPGKRPHAIELEVTEIELDEILLMVDQKGLEGNGQLGGTIPVRITDAGVVIDDGRLRNDTKGRIRYNPPGGNVPGLDNIALQALQDFRFQALDVNLDYQTSGDYTIRVRLEGRNPQLYDGYPIAFNINLSGALPGLLRASLLTGDFQTEILKQIQQEQQ